jgi:hypothetical protein
MHRVFKPQDRISGLARDGRAGQESEYYQAVVHKKINISRYGILAGKEIPV